MTDCAGLAETLINAHLKASPVAPAVSTLSRAEILTVQSIVSTALGPVAGFKVSAVPEGPPILAPIQARYIVANCGTRAVPERLGIELEVGFELVEPLPSASLPARPEKYFRPCVVLELVETRLSGEAAERPDLKFADFQINAGLVVGDKLEDWDGSDFGTLPARLHSQSESVLDGEGRVPGGSALANLDLLLINLGDHCGGLQVGQIVITGSLCGLPWFTPGADVSGWVEGLGAVSVKVEHA